MAPRPTPGRRAKLIAVAAAGTVLALGAVAVGAWMYAPRGGPADSAALPTGGSELLKIASADVQTVTSYDYRRLDADVRSAHGVMTGGLVEQYDSAMTTTRQVALKAKAVSAATVLSAGLESTRGDRATVLVFLNQQITRGEQTPTEDRSQVRAGLVRRQGHWLLDQITPLPAAPVGVEDVSWPGRQASSALKSAQSCIRALYSVDHRQLDATFSAVRECATGDVRADWTRSEAQFKSNIAGEQSVTRVSAIDVALAASTGPSQATVLAAVGIEVQTKTTPSATKKSVRIQATMSRVGGRWLLAKLGYV
jgi:Mce-associated membrane protein